MELDRIRSLFQALHDEGVDYVLVGGVAINLLGIARATEDVDLFLRPDSDNLERMKKALRRLWPDPEIDTITEQDPSRYAVIRYGPPDDDVLVDLIAKLGTEVEFDDLVAETIMLEGVPVRVATPETLGGS